MTLWRNKYGIDGTSGYFPTWWDADNNARAHHPAGLIERCVPVEVPKSKELMCAFLRKLENRERV